jgi:hypothetical protein
MGYVLAIIGDYEHHKDIEYKIKNVPYSCVELFERTVTTMKKAAHRFLYQPVGLMYTNNISVNITY